MNEKKLLKSDIGCTWQNRQNREMAIIKHKIALIQNNLHPGWANDWVHLNTIIKIRIVFLSVQPKSKENAGEKKKIKYLNNNNSLLTILKLLSYFELID